MCSIKLHLLDNFQTNKEYSKLRFLNYKKQPLKYLFPKNFDGKISNLKLYNNTKHYKIHKSCCN